MGGLKLLKCSPTKPGWPDPDDFQHMSAWKFDLYRPTGPLVNSSYHGAKSVWIRSHQIWVSNRNIRIHRNLSDHLSPNSLPQPRATRTLLSMRPSELWLMRPTWPGNYYSVTPPFFVNEPLMTPVWRDLFGALNSIDPHLTTKITSSYLSIKTIDRVFTFNVRWYKVKFRT